MLRCFVLWAEVSRHNEAAEPSARSLHLALVRGVTAKANFPATSDFGRAMSGTWCQLCRTANCQLWKGMQWSLMIRKGSLYPCDTFLSKHTIQVTSAESRWFNFVGSSQDFGTAWKSARRAIALASFGAWEGASPLQSNAKASPGSRPWKVSAMSMCTEFHRNSMWQSVHFDQKRWLLQKILKTLTGSSPI